MNDISKTRENRLRHSAQRQGLILVKSRARDRYADSFGLYVLMPDSKGNRANHGGQAGVASLAKGNGVGLDIIEHLLHWQDVFLVPEDEGPGSIEYPQDRAILSRNSRGWILQVGIEHPVHHQFGDQSLDSELAMEHAQGYLINWRDDF